MAQSGGARARVLLVDDDVGLIRLLRLWFESSGYQVDSAGNGLEALARLQAGRPDLVILDVSMPKLDGIETCRRIREQSSVPILMLTVLGDPDDRVFGLELGADEYLPKPFSVRELLLRSEALLRRARRNPYVRSLGHYRDDYLVVDVPRKIVRCGGVPVHLTKTEFAILALLVAHSGQVVSAERILQEVWGKGASALLERNVRVYIRYLRRKIEPDPSNPRYIHTERHLGYRFSAQAHEP
ncbi:MAG: response regulator transcription factor [Chloroflexi bacterium]|nr:response regulator transcription factor [Chloroflexota bacterium]